MTTRHSVVAFLVLLTSCASAPISEGPDPSEPPVVTEQPPSPSPTPHSTQPATAAPLLAPDDVAMVVTNDLVLRSAPGTGSDSDIYPGLLNEPTLLFVVDGPVSASGYQWYQVHPFSMAVEDWSDAWRLGWLAAAAKDGEAWIASSSLECDGAPTIESLIGLSGIASLACYGKRSLTFGASYEGPDAIIPSWVSPGWLNGFGYRLQPIGCVFECGNATPQPVEEFLFVHRRGEGNSAEFFGHESGADVSVVGHFDHGAAQSCVAGQPPGDLVNPPPEETILNCRTAFVVTEATGVIH